MASYLTQETGSPFNIRPRGVPTPLRLSSLRLLRTGRAFRPSWAPGLYPKCRYGDTWGWSLVSSRASSHGWDVGGRL